MSTRPGTPVRMPKMSRRWTSEVVVCPACRTGMVGMARKDAPARHAAVIAVAKYAHGHQANCPNKAENSAPTRKPPGAVDPKILKTISFLRPGGYVRPRIAIALGNRRAGPIP